MTVMLGLNSLLSGVASHVFCHMTVMLGLYFEGGGERGLLIYSAFFWQLYRLARYHGCRRGPVATRGKSKSDAVS